MFGKVNDMFGFNLIMLSADVCEHSLLQLNHWTSNYDFKICWRNVAWEET